MHAINNFFYPFNLITGLNLGFAYSSLQQLNQNLIPAQPFGRSNLQIFIKSNGNITIADRQFEFQNLNSKLCLGFIYNSQAENAADAWRLTPTRQLHIPKENASTLQVTESDGHYTEYVYNAATQSYYAPGGTDGTARIAYDATSKTWHYFNPKSREQEFFNSYGAVSTTIDANGNQTNYIYDSKQNLTAINTAGGTVFTIERDVNNKIYLYRQEPQQGQILLHTYHLDAYQRVIASVPSTGNKVTYTYSDNSARLTDIIQDDQTEMHFQFDAQARIKSLQVGNSSTTHQFNYPPNEFVFTDAGSINTTCVLDANGRLLIGKQERNYLDETVDQTCIDYYANGQVKSITYPDQSIEQFEYDALTGLILRQTNRDGQVIQNTYIDDLLISRTVSHPSSKIALETRFVYDKHFKSNFALLKYSISPEGCVTEWIRDQVTGLVTGERTYLTDRYTDPAADLEKLNTWKKSTQRAQTTLTEYTRDINGRINTSHQYANLTADGIGIADAQMSTTAFEYTPTDQVSHKTRLQTANMNGDKYQPQTIVNDIFQLNGADELLVQRLAAQCTSEECTNYHYKPGAEFITLPNKSIHSLVLNTQGLVKQTFNISNTEILETDYIRNANTEVTQIISPDKTVRLQGYDKQHQLSYTISALGCVVEKRINHQFNYEMSIEYGTYIDSKLIFDTNLNCLDAVKLQATLQSITLQRHHYQFTDALKRPLFNIDPLNHVTEFRYDEFGRQIAKIEYKHTLTESELQLLLSGGKLKRKPNRQQDIIHSSFYNKDGLKIAEQDPDGYCSLFSYDGASNLLSKQMLATPDVTFTTELANLKLHFQNDQDAQYFNFYDSKNQCRFEIDAEGYITEHTYHPNGKKQSSTLYANPVDSNWYNNTTRPPSPVKSANDHTIHYSYDELDRLIKTVGPFGKITTFSYDDMGHTIATVTRDESLSITSDHYRSNEKRFDAFGRLVAEANPYVAEKLTAIEQDKILTKEQKLAAKEKIWTDQSLRFTYLDKLKISETDSYGNTTYFYYDNDYQLIFSIETNGAIVEFHYNSFGERSCEHRYATRLDTQVISQFKGGLVTPELTTQLHKEINIHLDVITLFEHNHLGQVIKKTDAEKNSYEYEYDSFGQCVLEKIPVEKDQSPLVIRHEFDKRGNEIVIAKKHLESKINCSVKKDYRNLNNKVTTIIDENGHVTKFTYTRLGQLYQTKKIIEDGSECLISTLTYEGLGRIVSEIDAKNATTWHEYLDTKRLEIIHYPDGTTTNIEKNIFGESIIIKNDLNEIQKFKHAPDGKISEHTDPLNHTSKSDYDLLGRLTLETDANGIETAYHYVQHDLHEKIVDQQGLRATETYETNVLGQQEKFTTPNQLVTNNKFNRNGNKILALQDPSTADKKGLNLTTAFTYRPDGRCQDTVQGKVTRPQLLHTKKDYDALGRCVIETTDPQGLNISKSVAYDNTNKIVRELSPRGFLKAHFYDSLGRKVFSYEQIDVDKGRLLAWEYDAANNIILTRTYRNPISHSTITVATTLSDLEKIKKTATDLVTQFTYDSMNRARFKLPYAYHPGTQSYRIILSETRYDRAGREEYEIRYEQTLDATSAETLSTSDLEVLAMRIQDLNKDKVHRTLRDKAGREKYLIDADGYITEKKHDAVGNVIVIKHFKTPFTDRNAILNLSAADLITAIDPILKSNKVARKYYSYDSLQRRTHKINQKGEITRTIYDLADKPIKKVRFKQPIQSNEDYEQSIADAESRSINSEDNITCFEYDAVSRLKVSIDPHGRQERYAYDALGNNTKSINRNQHEWKFQFDRAKRKICKIAPLAKITTVNRIDNELVAEDENIHIRNKFDYDLEGHIIKVTKAAGHSSERAIKTDYDGLGNKIGTQMDNVLVDDSNLSADFYSSPTSTQTLITQIVRNVFGDIIAEKDEDNQWSYYAYDSLRRCIFEVSKEGGVSEKSYDAFNNIIYTTQYINGINVDANQCGPNGISAGSISTCIIKDPANDRTIEYKYDLRNHVTEIKNSEIFYHSAGCTGTASPLIIHQYDYRGNTLETKQLIRPDVFATKLYWYDDLKNIIAEIDPRSYVTIYRRDATGKVNRKLEYANPLSAAVTSTDSISTLISKITPDIKDRITVYHYDRIGNVIKEDYLNSQYTTVDLIDGIPKATLNSSNLTKHFHYDAMQQLVGVTYEDGSSINHYYDARGYLIASTSVAFTPLGESKIIPLTSYGIDAFGKTVQTTNHRSALTTLPLHHALPILPSNTEDRVELKLFDNRGKLAFSQDAAKNMVARTYNSRGKIARKFFINTEWLNDSLINRLDEVRTVYNSSNMPLQSITLRDYIVTEIIFNHYNIFNEYVSEGADNLTRETYQRFNPAGYAYASNKSGGVPHIYLTDLAGNVSLILTSEVIPLNEYAYSDLACLVEPNEKILRHENILDFAGEVVGIKAPFWRQLNNDLPTKSFVRDRWSNIVKEMDSYGRVTEHAYDFRNNLLQTIEPLELAYDNIDYAHTNTTTSYGYTQRGFLTCETNHFGNVTYRQLDEVGRIVKKILADGTISETNHRNVFGDIAYQTNSRGFTTTYKVNRLGQPQVMTHPSGKQQYYLFDPAGLPSYMSNRYGHGYRFSSERGNIISRLEPMGDKTHTEYDHNHAITRQIKPCGTTLEWKRNYFGVPFEYTDLSRVVTRLDYNYLGKLTLEYALQQGHGDRVIVDDTVWANPAKGWETFPVVDNLALRVADITKLTTYNYSNGLMTVATDYAASRVCKFDYDSEGRRYHLEMRRLKDSVLLFDILSNYDSRNRIFHTINTTRTSTSFYSVFLSDKTFDSTNNLRIEVGTLDAAGYGLLCRGGVQQFKRFSLYDVADRAIVINGFLSSYKTIAIGPSHGAAITYANGYRTSERLLFADGTPVDISIQYDIDGDLSHTQATNGIQTTRSTEMISATQLRNNYTEINLYAAPLYTNIVRTSSIDANQREIANSISSGFITTNQVTNLYYLPGFNVPSRIISSVSIPKSHFSQDTDSHISYIGHDEYKPYAAITTTSKDGKIFSASSIMSHNGYGVVNGKIGTADEYDPEAGANQPITHFETTTPDNIFVSKRNVRGFDNGQLKYQSYVDGFYNFSDIEGNTLAGYSEKYLAAPNKSGSHQLYHTESHLLNFGKEAKPTTGPLVAPLAVDMIGKYSLTTEEDKCNPYATPTINPPIEEQVYIVKKGDTFASIAQQLYGDADFAEEIIKRNGQLLESLLRPELILFIPQFIPNRNKNSTINNCQKFLSIVQGSILPYLSLPQHQPKKHKSFLKILVGVVIVGLAMLAAWQLAPFLLSSANIMGLIAADTATAGMSGLAGGTVTVASQIAMGVASAITNAAAQGVGIGLKLRDKFSIGEMAEAGIGSGIGMEPLNEFNAAHNATTMATAILKMGKAATEAQLIEMGLGTRSHFDASAIVAQMGALVVSAGMRVVPNAGMVAEGARNVTENTVNTIIGSALFHTPIDAETIAAQSLNDMLDNEIKERVDESKQAFREEKPRNIYAKDKGKVRKQTFDEHIELPTPVDSGMSVKGLNTKDIKKQLNNSQNKIFNGEFYEDVKKDIRQDYIDLISQTPRSILNFTKDSVIGNISFFIAPGKMVAQALEGSIEITREYIAGDVSTKREMLARGATTLGEDAVMMLAANAAGGVIAESRLVTSLGRVGMFANENVTINNINWAARNAANGTRLKTVLALQEANILDGNGRLTQAAIKASSPALGYNKKLKNPPVVEALTKHGGIIEDWEKLTTEMIRLSTRQRIEVHFYKNKITGEVNYTHPDFKVKNKVSIFKRHLDKEPRITPPYNRPSH